MKSLAKFDTDFINLGFSGNAKGEQEMTDYIKKLDMSVFVMDYDANAPTPEHLEATHKKMFKGIREVQPDLPIILRQGQNIIFCLLKRNVLKS